MGGFNRRASLKAAEVSLKAVDHKRAFTNLQVIANCLNETELALLAQAAQKPDIKNMAVNALKTML